MVPAEVVRPAGMCSGHYIALHCGACRRVLQARRERRLVLQVPEVLIEASANIGVKGERRENVPFVFVSVPLRLGDCSSFYRPRREQFAGVPHYSPTCEGMASSAAELTTILANLAPVGASWRVLCPYGSGFEGGGVEVGCPAAARGPTRRVVSTGGRTRYSGGRGDVLPPCASTTLGMSSQCPAWRCSGGDGRTGLTATEKTVPAGLTSRCSQV
jgi:hypothetical protein